MPCTLLKMRKTGYNQLVHMNVTGNRHRVHIFHVLLRIWNLDSWVLYQKKFWIEIEFQFWVFVHSSGIIEAGDTKCGVNLFLWHTRF